MKIAKFKTIIDGNEVELHKQPIADTPNKIPFDRANIFTFGGKRYALHHTEQTDNEFIFYLVEK